MLYDYLRRFSRGASRLPFKSWQTGYRHENHQRVPHGTEFTENSSGETAGSSLRNPSGSRGQQNTDPSPVESNGPWPPKTQNAFYPLENKFHATGNPDVEHHGIPESHKHHPPDTSRCYPGSNVQAPHWIQHPRPSLPSMINIPRVPDPQTGESTVIYAGPGSESCIQPAPKKASDSVISFIDGSYKIVDSGKTHTHGFDLGSQLTHRVHECEPSICNTCGSIKIGSIETTDAHSISTNSLQTLGLAERSVTVDQSDTKPVEKLEAEQDSKPPVGQLETEPVQGIEMQAVTQKSGTTVELELKPTADSSTNNGEFQTEQACKDMVCKSVQQAHSSEDSSGGKDGTVAKATVDSNQGKTGYLQAECIPFQANRQLTIAHSLNLTGQEQTSSSNLNGFQAASELSVQAVQRLPCMNFTECSEQLLRKDQIFTVPSYAESLTPKSNVIEVLPTSVKSKQFQTSQQGFSDDAQLFSCQCPGDQNQGVDFNEKGDSTWSTKRDEIKAGSETTSKIRSVDSPTDSTQQDIREPPVNCSENKFDPLLDEIHSFQEKTVTDHEDMLKSPFWNVAFLEKQQIMKEDFPRVEELMSKILATKEKLTQQNEEVTQTLAQEISSVKVELTKEIAALRAKMGEANTAQEPTEGIEQMRQDLLNEIATVKNVCFQNIAQLTETSVQEMRSLKEELKREISSTKLSERISEETLKMKELVKDIQLKVVDIGKPARDIAALREEIKDQTMENKLVLEKPVKEILKMNNQLLKEIAIVKDKANQQSKFMEKPELASMKEVLLKKMVAIETTLAQNFEASSIPAEYVKKMKDDLMKEIATIKQNLLHNKETAQKTNQATMAMEGLMKTVSAIGEKLEQNIQASMKPTNYVVKMKEDLMKEMVAIKNILDHNNVMLQGTETAAIRTKKISNRGDNVQSYAPMEGNPLLEIATMKNDVMREMAAIKTVLQNKETAQNPLQEIATMKEDLLKEMAAIKIDIAQDNETKRKPSKDIDKMKEDLMKELADLKISTVETYKMATEKSWREMEENLLKEIADMKATTIENYDRATGIPMREIATVKDELMKEMAAIKADTLKSYAMATQKPVNEIATMKNELMNEMAVIKGKVLQNNESLLKPAKDIATMKVELMKEMAALKTSTVENYKMAELSSRLLASIRDELMKEMASIKDKTTENCALAASKPVQEIAIMKTELMREIASIKNGISERNVETPGNTTLIEDVEMIANVRKVAVPQGRVTENTARFAELVPDIPKVESDLINELESFKKLTIQNALSAAIRMKEISWIKEQLSSALKISNENTFKAFDGNNLKSAGTSEMQNDDQQWPGRSQISLQTVDSGDRCSLTGDCPIPYHSLRPQKQTGDSARTKPPGFDKPPSFSKSKKTASKIEEAEPREGAEIGINAKEKLVHRPTERSSPSTVRPPFKGAQPSSETNAKSPTNSSKRPPLCSPLNKPSSYNRYSTNPPSGEIPSSAHYEGPWIPTSVSSAQIKNEIAAMKANTIENHILGLEYPCEDFSKIGNELAREMTAIKKLTIENYLMLTEKGEDLLYRRTSDSVGPLNIDLAFQHDKIDSGYKTSKAVTKTVQDTSPGSALTDSEITCMKAITLENYIMARENGFDDVSKWKENSARDTISVLRSVADENSIIAVENPFERSSKIKEELTREKGMTGNLEIAVEKPKSVDFMHASSISSNTPVESKSTVKDFSLSTEAENFPSEPPPISQHPPPRRSSSCSRPRSSNCGSQVVQCRPPPPRCCPPVCAPPCPGPCQPPCPPNQPPCPSPCPPPCPPPCTPPSQTPCPTKYPSSAGGQTSTALIETLENGVVPIEESKIRNYFSKGANITLSSLEIRAAGCPCPPSKPDNTDKRPENSSRPSSSSNIGDKPPTSSGTPDDKPQPPSDNAGDKPPASLGGRNRKPGKPRGISPPPHPGSKPPNKSGSTVRMGRSSTFSDYSVPPRPETFSVKDASRTPPSNTSGSDQFLSGSISGGGNPLVYPISTSSIDHTQPSSSSIIDDGRFPSGSPVGGRNFTKRSVDLNADSSRSASRRRSCNPAKRPVRDKPRLTSADDYQSNFSNKDNGSLTLQLDAPQSQPPSESDKLTSLNSSVSGSLNKFETDKTKSSDSAKFAGNLERRNKCSSRPVRLENLPSMPSSTPDNVTSLVRTLNDDGSHKIKSSHVTDVWSLELESKGDRRPVNASSGQVATNLATTSQPSDIKPAEWDEKGIAKVRFNLPEQHGQSPDPVAETSFPSKKYNTSWVDDQQTWNPFSNRLAPKPLDMIWRVTYPFNFPKPNRKDSRRNANVSKSSSTLKKTDETETIQNLRGLRQREAQEKKTDRKPNASTTNLYEHQDVESNKLDPQEHDSGNVASSKQDNNLPVVFGKPYSSSQERGSAKASTFAETDLPSVQLATILLLSRAAESSRMRMNKPVSKDPAHRKSKNGQTSNRNSASAAANRRPSSPSPPSTSDHSSRPRNTIDITYHEVLPSTNKRDTTGVGSQAQKPWNENSVERQNEILSKLANLPIEKNGLLDRTTRLASLSQTDFDSAYFLRECAVSKPRYSSVIFSKDYTDDIAYTDQYFSKENKSADRQQDEKLNVAVRSAEQSQTTGLDADARKAPIAVSLQVLTKQYVAEHNKKITELERKMSAVREKYLKLQYIKEKYKTEIFLTSFLSWKEQLRSLLPDPKALDRAIAEVLSFDARGRSTTAESTGSSKMHSKQQYERMLQDDVEFPIAKVSSGEMRSSKTSQVNQTNATNMPRKHQQLTTLPSIPKQTEKTSKSPIKTRLAEPKNNKHSASVPDLTKKIANMNVTEGNRPDKLSPKFKQPMPSLSVTNTKEINEPSVKSQSKPTKKSSTTLPPQVIQVLESGKVETQAKSQRVPPTPEKPPDAFPKFKGPTVSSGSRPPKKPPGQSLHTAVSTPSGSCVGFDGYGMCKSYASENLSDQNVSTKRKQSGPPGCPCAENTVSAPPEDSAGSSDGVNLRGDSRRKPANDGSLPIRVKDGLNKQMATEMGAFLRYFKMMAHFGRVDVAYRGIESFLRKQVEEEREHAVEIASWTNLRGSQNQMSTIGKDNVLRPECLGSSHSAALAEAVSMEVQVTKSLHGLRETSETSSDIITSKYLTNIFLREQTESIDEISRLLTNAQRAEDSPRQMHTFDEKLYAKYG